MHNVLKSTNIASYKYVLHTFVCLTKHHSKKCWVKYNPALGKIWMNPAIVLLDPAVGLNI